ncbi:MAG: hypothetical protein ABSE49_15040 [Polyangiaceae bacterium]|jgi:hypothetical protein
MSTLRFSIALVLPVTFALTACSSANPGPDPEPTQSGAAAVETESRGPCPSSLPKNGSSCSDDDLLCSWGTDPRFGCREEARCNSGKWENLTYSCPSREPSCPRSAPQPPDGGQNTCTTAQLGLTCAYGDTAYTCAPCDGTLCTVDNVWFTATLAKGCPDQVPNFGQSCSSPGTYCNYNICADDQMVDWVFGASMECEGGVWTAYADAICL